MLYKMHAAVGTGSRPAARNSALRLLHPPAGAPRKSTLPQDPAARRRTSAHGPRVTCKDWRPAPLRAVPPNTPTPAHGAARTDGTGAGGTCEAGEAGNAVRDRQLLEVGGQLHLHDAGHAVQDHPAAGVRCPAAALA